MWFCAVQWFSAVSYLYSIRNWPLIASCRCEDFPFLFLKASQQPLRFGSIVFCKVLDLNCYFNIMTGYEIPCFSFPAFVRCLQDIEVPIKATLLWYSSVACISQLQALSVNYNNANLKIGTHDVIIPPFAVVVVTVASQGETLLLTLFSFCGESGTTVSD